MPSFDATDELILFKTARIAGEWNGIGLSPRVKIIIYSLAAFVWEKFKTRLTITCIFRTDAEQNAIYAGDPAYAKTPWRSTHQEWRAADIRVIDPATGDRIFSDSQVQVIVDFLNRHFAYTGNHPTSLAHAVGGNGFHLHIQVDGDGKTEIREQK